jgi:protein associated with RNAse G/E
MLQTLGCAAVAAANIIIESKKKSFRKRWMAYFLERRNRNLNIFGEVRMDSCAIFRNITRITASGFELLLQLIGPSVKKQD